jgi:hypothetical protein
MSANDNAPPYFEILTYPRDALLLRRKARPVLPDEFGTPAFLDFVQRLGDTCMAAGGMGLAATQVEEHPGGEAWAVYPAGGDAMAEDRRDVLTMDAVPEGERGIVFALVAIVNALREQTDALDDLRGSVEELRISLGEDLPMAGRGT